jgi:hypothetical protein
MLASDITGVVSSTRDSRFRFGPYLRSIPINPINGRNDVRGDLVLRDVTGAVRSLPESGWKFYPRTGVLIPNHAEAVVGHLQEIEL